MNAIGILRGVILGASLSLASSALYAEMDHATLERLVGELADKPEHHKAIAEYYRSRAEDTKKEIELHKKMKNSYVSFNPKNPGNPTAMKAHCEKLVSTYETALKEYEQMAQEHEKAAKDFVESLPR